jgi:GT2 family glycosyltransferase
LTERAGGYVYAPPRCPPDLESRLAALARRPQFSIVVPVYNTSTDFLARMLASVRAQWYPHWELILIDDASPSPDTRAFLEQITDRRVRVKLLAQNLGISGATNAALALVTGDFVVFLDHDDELTEDCLYELAMCVEREDPDFIYSDEDKISPSGTFVEPFFKPDWSPDTMMSIMYTCHVGCIRLETLREAGPLASEYDGAQDWDLVLRVTERTSRIAHIPKVLYHWRIIPSSISASINAKPHAVDASIRLREAALRRRELSGVMEVVDGLPTCHRVRYIAVDDPLVSIIIPSRDNGALLKKCIGSMVRRSIWPKIEFIVVDNGSHDSQTLAELAGIGVEYGCRVIRHDADFNFSELCNLGARHANGKLLLFLNDDTEIKSADAIARMAGYAQLPHIGAVGAKLLYPETLQIQHVGIINLGGGPGHALAGLSRDVPGYFLRNTVEYNWIAVTGACLMIQRDRFEAVGRFDESLPIAYNDVELCIRLVRCGLYNVVCPTAEWIHHESLSRGSDDATDERRQRLRREREHLYDLHPEFFMKDPFFNANLRPDSVYFELGA